MKINGNYLLSIGIKPGKHMGEILSAARKIGESDGEAAALKFISDAKGQIDRAENSKVELRKTNPAHFDVFMDLNEDSTAEEWNNSAAVTRDMRLLMQCPTVTRGAIMPDACPAGTISVGGVVETENAIHPGFHSADICCSVMATIFDGDADPEKLLNAAHVLTHFGGGGRPRGKQIRPSEDILNGFRTNPYLRDMESDAIEHFATQGDGNHFLFVGRLRSNGKLALVTHHGSRRPGALLYKRGMNIAKAHTDRLARGIPDGMAWIEASSTDGQNYWDALTAIREWTRASHYTLHNLVERATNGIHAVDRFWNEHNFVFMRDGKFIHAKGATPAYTGFGGRDPLTLSSRVLIPMNMSEPILVARGQDNPAALGFAPHGAGRNVSRSQHMRNSADAGAAELQMLKDAGLDIRFWFDAPDATELPSAYKDARKVIAAMGKFNLAAVEDYIDPYGCIMAGNWVRR